MAQPSPSCIHCARPIKAQQSYRVHTTWFTRIHNACYWSLVEHRIQRMRVFADDPTMFAAEAQSLVTLHQCYSLPRLDQAVGEALAAS